MKRIVVVKWDLRRGPQPVVQYPPEKTFLSNETFLKLWSIHELQENPVISLGEEKIMFLSYRETLKTGTYFVVLATDEHLEEGFGEMHAGMSNSLLSTLDTPHFLPSLQEMYKIIGEYITLAPEQLIATLFQDQAKVALFEEIRSGVFNKDQLQKAMKKKHGLAIVNFDLLISPFIRLGILRPETLFDEEYLFLQKDFFVARLPAEYVHAEKKLGPEGPQYVAEVRKFFTENPEPPSQTIPLSYYKYFRDPAFTALRAIAIQPLPTQKFFELLKEDEALYAELVKNKVVIEINERIFLLANVSFVPLTPSYILGELKKRYLDHQISIEVVLRQVEIIENR